MEFFYIIIIAIYLARALNAQEATEADVETCLTKLVNKLISINGNFLTQEQCLEVLKFNLIKNIRL